MTTKQALDLYKRAGKNPPPELDAHAAAEKVHNTRRKIVDGIEFRSTLESQCYQILRLWEKAGRISDLKCQPILLLQARHRDRFSGKIHRAITYRPDFMFIRDNQVYAIDAKGYRMDVFRVKWKMAIARFPHVRFEMWTRDTLKRLI